MPHCALTRNPLLNSVKPQSMKTTTNMANRKSPIYSEAFSTDDVYLGEIAAEAARHERAELERTQRKLDEQAQDVSDIVRTRTNPWSV